MRRFLLFVLLAEFLLVIFLVSGRTVKENIIYTLSKADDEYTIVLDSGHGGIDGGAVAADGTVEKNINLAITLKLNDLFSFFGYNTVLIRSDDRLICDETSKTIRQQKSSDLHNRLEKANSCKNPLLISIHQNKFSVPKYCGTQVFYSPKNEKSKLLALSIQNSVVSLLQNDNNRKIKESGKEIFLLYNAVFPAVMVECGFISNPNELSMLKNDEYQNKISFTIFTGLIDFNN